MFLEKSNLALFASCGEPSVFALGEVFSWLETLTGTSTPWRVFFSWLETLTGTSTSWRVFFSWLDVVKGFSVSWRGSSYHPSLLSSVDVQAFFCCRAHQCVLIFSEWTKLLIWPLVMFLLSRRWICLVYEAYQSSVSLAWGDPLTAWCGFTATVSKCKWHT